MDKTQSDNTVHRPKKEHISNLADLFFLWFSLAGITKEKNRFALSNLQASNTYHLTDVNPEKYFLLPAYLFDEVMAFEQPVRAGKILYMPAYLSYCTGQNNECFPSNIEITLATGISSYSQNKYFSVLSDEGILAKMNYVRAKGGNGRNHYFFVKRLEAAVGKAAAAGLKAMMEAKKAVYKDLCWYKAVISGMIAFFAAQEQSALAAEAPAAASTPAVIIFTEKRERAHCECALSKEHESFAAKIHNKVSKALSFGRNIAARVGNFLFSRLPHCNN